MSEDDTYALAQLAVLLSLQIKVMTRRHNTIGIGEMKRVDEILNSNLAVLNKLEEESLRQSGFDFKPTNLE